LNATNTGSVAAGGNVHVGATTTNTTIINNNFPAAASPPAAPPPGLLRDATDPRLQMRADAQGVGLTEPLGRADEINQVLAFLRGEAKTQLLTAVVQGVGGIGKTEVCKAALKTWLPAASTPVYFVETPDGAGMARFVGALALATGGDASTDADALLTRLPEGLYYLDNLEEVIDDAEGQALLTKVCQRPGLRVLASSRSPLKRVFGKALIVGRLAGEPALKLFRAHWPAENPLPADDTLAAFVDDSLAGHPLSIELAARLGQYYRYDELLKRWQEDGATALRDSQDRSRHGSLPTCLRLSAAALARRDAGALGLWTFAALFAENLPNELLADFEKQANSRRDPLVALGIITRVGEGWQCLSPLARYALDAALKEQEGFSWPALRPLAQAALLAKAMAADSIASTDTALVARAWVLRHFAAYDRAMRLEMQRPDTDQAWLATVHQCLLNQYPFRAAESRALLTALGNILDQAGSVRQRLGDLERRLGEVGKAREHFAAALALFEKEQAGLGRANTLKSLGDLESRLGEVGKAREHYAAALALYRSEQNPVGLAYTLAEIARCAQAGQRGEERDQAMREALMWAERSQLPPVLEYVTQVLFAIGGDDAGGLA
jgi:tetratricopeptide (TPR) repeat protein